MDFPLAIVSNLLQSLKSNHGVHFNCSWVTEFDTSATWPGGTARR